MNELVLVAAYFIHCS